ncbi:hypothetical protein JRI60_46115 [Archangium violaceum]|uniref:hypothetical protein n=1 Tax=Archangium violaceum TaxID=83451 RepID=UPI00194DD52C|nr:hypothetical protein [Archangium violaceum]QRN96317.1 hypothetical protein JRI60_46115 [Archangium violaceum]
MSLTVKAVLFSPTGESVVGIEAQVCIFMLNGSAQVIGTGKTDAKGALLITTNWQAPSTYQPRLQLLVRRGTAFVELAENLQSFANEAADFGSLALPALVAGVVQPMVTIPQGAIPVVKPTLGTAIPTAATIPVTSIPVTSIPVTSIPVTSIPTTSTPPIPAPTTETSLQQVFEGTGTQVQRAQDALRTSNSNFRLGKVSLQLKVLPGTTAGSVVLPKPDDITKVGNQGLSQINFDLESVDKPQLPIPTATAQPLPLLTGYTEVHARRLLAGNQLQLEVLQQLVDREEDVGRVMLQRPPAGTPMKPRTLVTIAVGRKG